VDSVGQAGPLAGTVALHIIEHELRLAATASHKQFQLPLHIRNTQLTLFNKGPASNTQCTLYTILYYTLCHTTAATITIIIMHSSLYDGPTYKLGLDNSVNHKEIAEPERRIY